MSEPAGGRLRLALPAAVALALEGAVVMLGSSFVWGSVEPSVLLFIVHLPQRLDVGDRTGLLSSTSTCPVGRMMTTCHHDHGISRHHNYTA